MLKETTLTPVFGQQKCIKKFKESNGKLACLHELITNLYYHRLFNFWPKLRTGKHREAKNAILKKSIVNSLIDAEARNYCRQHYSFLSNYDTFSPQPGSQSGFLPQNFVL